MLEEAESKQREEDIWTVLCQRHGLSAQKKLQNARVAIAGLGGLGSNVATTLARIGIGHLHLIDFDVVDLSNLNRQQYFIRQVGRYKTDALKEILLEINPYLKVHTDCVRVTEENCGSLFEKDAYICEAFDQPEQKAMLVNSVLTQFPDKILVAGSGMAGYGKSNDIRTREINRHFYLCGDERTQVEPQRGLMAPRVTLCAAHQSNLIVDLILRTEEGENKL